MFGDMGDEERRPGAVDLVSTDTTESVGVSRTGDTVTLTMPAKPEYVGLCRLALSGLGQRCGLDLETVADLKVAVSEACSWSIRRADPARKPGKDASEIHVEIGVESGLWTIIVGDWLTSEPDGWKKEEDPFSENDLGLTVIRALVDEVREVNLDEKHSAIVMTKRLP
jgi:serine/threonine-protein kinase RsbW